MIPILFWKGVGFVPLVWQLLCRVPTWLWIVLAVGIGFVTYGKYVEKKTTAAVELKYKLAEEAEKKRQAEVFKKAGDAATIRRRAQIKWQEQVEKDREAALEQLKKDMEDEQRKREAQWRRDNPKVPITVKAPVCDCSTPGTFLDRLPRPKPNPNRRP